MQEQEYVVKLKELLVGALRKILNGTSDKIGIAFSGGVDSCIIAKLLMDLDYDVVGYVVGVEGCRDFESAEKAASELGLELKRIELSDEEIEKELPVQIKILYDLYKSNVSEIRPETPESKLNPVSVTSNFPLFFVEKHCEEKNILSGLGADTIFGGFKKYLKLNRQESEKQILDETDILVRFDYKEDLETARYLGKEILMPFLDKGVVNFALKLPYEMKIKDSWERKYILRLLAKEIGLDDGSVLRPKKSAQYGTGIMKIIKKLSKKKGMNVGEYVEGIRKLDKYY